MIALLAATLLSASPVDDGPWRQLIDFNATQDQPDGVSLFVREANMLPQGAGRSRDTRTARQLWVRHGALVGDQAYVVIDSVLDCDGGGMTNETVRAFDIQGRVLGEARADERVDAIPHSAEHMVWDAVCMGSPYLYDKPIVSTLAEATADAGGADAADLTNQLNWDIDYDGQPDIVRIQMRPHSMRHDVEFLLAKDLSRAINVVTAHQPPTGPLVERRIRPLDRDRYLVACAMDEGRDVEPCQAGYPLVQRGVEVVTEGHPTILVWLVAGEPYVARLPVAE